MMTRTIHQFDIRHTGDETDRLEILGAFRLMAGLLTEAHIADVTVASVKTDLISVTVERVEVTQ